MVHQIEPIKQAPETFSEAARGGLTTINALVLLACTLCSAGLTLYADLARGAGPAVAGGVAIAGWLLTLGLALVLAGRAAGARAPMVAFRKGLSLLRARPGFALLVVVISAGAAFTAWSRAVSDQGGVLAGLVPELRAVREDTASIRRAVAREIPHAEKLARLGFTMSKEDICRALGSGNVEVWRLMREIGLPGLPVAVAVSGGQHATCIEEQLLRSQQNGRWSSLLKELPNPDHELDRLYLSRSIGLGHEQPLDPAASAHAANATKPRALAYAFAPLIMYAVWGGDDEAVAALLAAGADPNTPAHLEMMAATRYALAVSPLAEAERLQRTETLKTLRAAGGRATVVKKASMFRPARNTRAYSDS